LEYLKYFAY
jgi:hypothetical protein